MKLFAIALLCAATSAAALDPTDIVIETDADVAVQVERRAGNTSKNVFVTINKQDRVTIKPRVGGFGASGLPRIDLSKIPPVDPAVKYTTNRVSKLTIDPATGLPAYPGVFYAAQNLTQPGAFRELCAYAGMNQDDAIVFPGKPGAAHLHTYFGVIADAFTTTAGILNAPWSTCAGGLLNRTAYWMPSMIDTLDGTPLAPMHNNAYYKGNYSMIGAAKDIIPLPEGLHLIAGDSANTDPAKARGRFICYGPAGQNPGWKTTIKAAFADGTCVPGGRFFMELDFPMCWDGVNLDSPDHKSHVVGLVQDQTSPWAKHCPATHPKQLPSMAYNVEYAIPDNVAVSRWFLSSDKNPDCPGCSSHGDYFIGWDRPTIENFVQHCLNEQRDGHNYLLCDNVNRLY